MKTYVATIAVKATWFGGDKIEQFDFQWGKKTHPTHEDIMREVRALKRYKNYRAISAIQKN